MRLIDADALKSGLHMGNVCEECERDARKCQYYDFISRMDICSMLDDAPTVGGWISVDDELPDAAGLGVLVNAVNRFGQDSIFIAFRGFGDFRWYTMDATKMAGDKDNSVNVAWKITHWMPILPPKEGI